MTAVKRKNEKERNTHGNGDGDSAGTPVTNSFMNPMLLLMTSGEIPYPCRSAIRASHAGSMFLDDSMIPLVLTPTCETCTNECGAGPEMMFALMGLDGGGDDGVLVFSFFVELERNGRKTPRMVQG